MLEVMNISPLVRGGLFYLLDEGEGAVLLLASCEEPADHQAPRHHQRLLTAVHQASEFGCDLTRNRASEEALIREQP